ncbi:SGNH/GDSL hydrolase family protein [Streptomyces sp. NPDC058268]|uniref:SGNH/GDSL hydrolase family protein n=1 Tax=Streptomyces sp. NPDC058268 TaxID=3346413 RepID=UPI0036E45B2E
MTVPHPMAFRIGWFGTSIMEHREAYSSRMADPAALPAIGDTVVVDEHCSRGYVYRVHLALQLAHPHLAFDCDNRGEGGATSRDIAATVRALPADTAYELAVFGCGINDVWRAFQVGRRGEAVSVEEYAEHYTAALVTLATRARRVMCVSETPFGPVAAPETVTAMNTALTRYNEAATRCAAAAGASFIDAWTPFTATARALARHRPGAVPALWSDGVHLSDLGVALLAQQVEGHLREHRIVEQLHLDTLPALHGEMTT